MSAANLSKNLNHRQIRILNSENGGGDSFARYLWDGPRTFLLNAGGSHHFAAARYIASRLKIPVALKGRRDTYRIHADSALTILQEYDLFVLSEEQDYHFRLAMQTFKASYGTCKMPPPYHDSREVIFLPQREPRSVAVAAVLREAGVFDMSEHIRRSLIRQPSNFSEAPVRAIPDGG